MDTKNLYIAEVIDINDPDQERKVQIFIDAIHSQSDSANFPWAFPFSGGDDFILPEVGDYIWVFFEQPKIFQNPFYMATVTNRQSNTVQKYIDIQNNLGDGTGPTTDYPDIKYMSAPNGCIIGMSTSRDSPEIFIAHPEGASFFIDSNGQLIIEAKNVKVITSSQTDSAIAVNDASYEVACTQENYIVTSLGLQQILPATDPIRAVTKIKN